MNKMLMILMLLAVVFLLPVVASAGPIAYTINFTGTGLLPTAGSFTYNPDTTTFSNFLVSFSGINFDMTAVANSPFIGPYGMPSCVGSVTGAAASFALLSGACSPPDLGGVTQWIGYAGNASSRFYFMSGGQSGSGKVIDLDVIGGPVNSFISSEGSWSLTVPEPSLMLLLGLGLGAVTLIGWRFKA